LSRCCCWPVFTPKVVRPSSRRWPESSTTSFSRSIGKAMCDLAPPSLAEGLGCCSAESSALCKHVRVRKLLIPYLDAVAL
jgi:hypothetical protein